MLKRNLRNSSLALLLPCLFSASHLTAQVTCTPVFPTADEAVTFTFNPQEGDRGLAAWTGDIYAHTGITTAAGDWQNVNATWGAQLPTRKMTRQANGTYTISYTSIRSAYSATASDVITAVSFVFHNGAGNNSIKGAGLGGADIFYRDIVQANSPLRTRFVTPSVSSLIPNTGDVIAVKAAASQLSTLTLTDNGVQVGSAVTNSKELNANITASQAGSHRVVFKAVANSVVDSSVFTYILVPTVQNLPLPAINNLLGANPNAAGDSVTFVFQAPRKQNVFVIGSFNDYQLDSKYFMNKADTATWWVKIGGLTPGQTYTYQYLVDGSLRVADPLSILVLDPSNDSRIPTTTFPNMPPYPTGKTTGFVSVITPGKAAYVWKSTNYVRPAKSDLVIYELLTRDFVAKHDYQTLIDTINYLKNLKVNAIELMPVNEFDNNESWGYNPTFHMALDKYYGTPDKFKDFVDLCHANGIAVIVDVVFNHIWGGSTLSALYLSGGKPSADNPWLNPDAKHPYNVGFDMNHESLLTKAYVERCATFLLKEYNLDGFRWDLAKGFTQNAKCNGSQTDENCLPRYDQIRVDIWKRYHSTIQAAAPGTYTILELFSDNAEETALVNEGMMVWGNTNYNYNEATMGYTNNGVGGVAARSRGWTTATNANGLVGYMESHDEERLNFKNLQYGNVSGSYSVKDLRTALRRIELASAFFYTVPGPKMLWQAGELGFDVSINDGGCRICNRPFRWDYFADANRRRLYDVTRNLIFLKTSQPAFRTLNYDHNELNSGYSKAFHITDASLNVTVVGNFNVVAADISANFQKTGKWYDYLSGDSITVTNVAATRTYLPGEYHVYLDKRLVPPSGFMAGAVGTAEFATEANEFSVYPTPSVSGRVFVAYNLRKGGAVAWDIFNLQGQRVGGSLAKTLTSGSYQDEMLEKLAAGTYFVRLSVNGTSATRQMVVVE